MDKLKIQQLYETFDLSEKMNFLNLTNAVAVRENAVATNLIIFESPMNNQIKATNKPRIILAIKTLLDREQSKVDALQQALNELDFDNPLNLPKQRFVGKFSLDDETFYIVKDKHKKG